MSSIIFTDEDINIDDKYVDGIINIDTSKKCIRVRLCKVKSVSENGVIIRKSSQNRNNITVDFEDRDDCIFVIDGHSTFKSTSEGWAIVRD